MKAISEDFLEEAEQVAREGFKQLRAYFKYEGDRRDYFNKARLGATAVSSYARLRASESNRMGVELMAQKILSTPVEPLFLPKGKR